jgi:dolichol kinase
MTHSLVDDSQQIALELYRLLRDLDARPSETAPSLAYFRRCTGLVGRLDHVLSRGVEGPLGAALAAVRSGLKSHTDVDDDAGEQWASLRTALIPHYEALARQLRTEAVHVPSLRPTNYIRNAFHVFGGFLTVGLVWFVLPPGGALPVAAAAAASAWSLETARRFSPRFNGVLMTLFAPVAHPHEAHRVNSSTWWATALVLLAALLPMSAALAGVAVLAVGDPAAALVGRRFGRHRIKHGRSVEGTVSFVLTGAVAAAATLLLGYPELGTTRSLSMACAAAVAGAAAELFASRIDDNLAIPLAAAAAAAVVGVLA